jgi:hypothetical protein
LIADFDEVVDVFDAFACLAGIEVVEEDVAFVDFCRVVAFFGASGFSETTESKTTFFGLPLFLTTSADDMIPSGDANIELYVRIVFVAILFLFY